MRIHVTHGFAAAGAAALLLAISAVAATTATAQPTDPLDALVHEGLRNNLALEQERLADARSETAVREARGRGLPQLSLDSRYSRTRGVLNLGDLVNPAYRALNQLTGSDAFPTDVDARLPLSQETRLRLVQPLFQPAVRHGTEIARSLREAQRGALGAETRQLAADIQTAYLDHARAARVVELFAATVPLLEENLRVSERLVARGVATSEGVFRARAELADVEQRRAEAERGRAAAARRLAFLLGRPDDAPAPVFPDSLLDAGPEPSLDDALVSAASGREELRQADAGIRAAQAQRRLATAAYLPGVALALDYGVQGDRFRLDGEDDFAVASLTLSWNLFNGGQDAARRGMATLDRDRARLRRVEAGRQVALQVRQAYDAVAQSRDAIGVAAARLAAARRSFELTARRHEQGLAPQVEFLDARVAFTSAALNEIVTRYEYLQRRVELERAAALRVLEP